jgi:hypothetical protein
MFSSFTLAIISTRHGGSAGSVLDNSSNAPVKTAPAK